MGCQKHEAGLFSVVPINSRRGSGYKLKCREYRLIIRNLSFTLSVVKQWSEYVVWREGV